MANRAALGAASPVRPPNVELERQRGFARLPLVVAGARILLDQWQRALAWEPGVRTGDDPEDVHKMRVALRRLRAAAQVFGGAFDQAAATALAGELTRSAAIIALALGDVRDRDVLIAYLRQQAKEASGEHVEVIERLIERQKAERLVARDRAVATLDGPAMERLRQTMTQQLAPLTVRGGADGAGGTVRSCGPRLVAKRLRRLRRLRKTLFVPRPEDLHHARISAKKLRYTAEFLTPAFPSTLPPLAQLATQIQDTLGQVHDLDVFGSKLLEEIEQVAQDPVRAGGAAIIARLVQRIQEQRDEALGRIPTLWAALPRPSALRAQLDATGQEDRSDDE